ncbi:hypothetical protein T10_12511 [Trichinella papuae]|uniref:Uncharacterized protein n=1 Tax=Trichinella papuae TaxID=268474 RepID=A0A0V1MX78_9BILA|nr:hypothetical protein T10_12511 [Trichinella papuae]
MQLLSFILKSRRAENGYNKSMKVVNSGNFQSNNPKPISSSSSSDSGFFSSFFAAGALVSGFGASAVVGAAATEADPTPLLKQFNKSPMSTLDNAFT